MPRLGNRVNFAIWTIVEINIGIISACLPSMRPLLSALTDRFKRAPREYVQEIPGYHQRSALSKWQRWRAIRTPYTSPVGSLSKFTTYTFDAEDGRLADMTIKPIRPPRPDTLDMSDIRLKEVARPQEAIHAGFF